MGRQRRATGSLARIQDLLKPPPAGALSTPEEVADYQLLRTTRGPKVEWLDSDGRATRRDIASRVRLTKRTSTGLRGLVLGQVVVTPAEAEVLLRGTLL